MGLKTFLGLFLVTFGLGLFLFFVQDVKVILQGHKESVNKATILVESLMEAPSIKLDFSEHKPSPTRKNCHHFNCFDVYKCGGHHKKILIHIPEVKRIMVGSTEPKEVAPITKDFLAILESIVESDFYTEDPKEACVFVPAINLINEAQVDPEAGARALPLIAGPSWNDGVNNLLFSFVTGHPDGLRMDHGAAMVAASGLSSFSYRSGFDVALPSYSILQEKLAPATRQNRDILLLSSQGNDLHEKYRPMLEDLTNLGDKATAVLNRCTDDSDAAADQIRCDDHKYLQTLSRAKFCLIGREKQSGLTSPALLEAMHSGCVPVILVDSLVLPFSDVLDWKRFSLRLYEHDAASRVFQVISNISDARHQEMQTQVKFIYSQYFKDLKTITETTLKILNDRVFPHHASNYRDWNLKQDTQPPLFMNHKPPASEGFTAVILTYDRLDSLYQVIKSVAETPSLANILVLWNNQDKSPPPMSEWPQTGKPLKVVRTKANLLTNRFFPYEEITTEAVLSMDDDIVMLTADELEFAYQVWREFPDRLVGFPSRTHVWNNVTDSWRYESEWTNDVSMVLTGAAFYHKYWHYLFTAAPSPQAKEIMAWLDHQMNCEDIAMNFLIANATGKAPIKVTPRKKFKCSTPQCNNVDMLSNYQSHLVERSDCVNMLVDKYGYMPLKKAEFRADPVLFKDKFPEKLKQFVNIGSL